MTTVLRTHVAPRLSCAQALKFESHHNSYLARFLLRRALRARLVIGHQLFWLLKVRRGALAMTVDAPARTQPRHSLITP